MSIYHVTTVQLHTSFIYIMWAAFQSVSASSLVMPLKTLKSDAIQYYIGLHHNKSSSHVAHLLF